MVSSKPPTATATAAIWRHSRNTPRIAERTKDDPTQPARVRWDVRSVSPHGRWLRRLDRHRRNDTGSIVGGVGISRRLRMDAPPPHRLSEPAVTSLIARGAREGTGIGSPLGYEKTVEFPREPHFRDYARQHPASGGQDARMSEPDWTSPLGHLGLPLA
jgi:hypothetical protein